MCVSCFEISISVVVKHVKSIGIIRAFCLPGGGLVKILSAWGTEETAGLWFARGGSVPRLTLQPITDRYLQPCMS